MESPKPPGLGPVLPQSRFSTVMSESWLDVWHCTYLKWCNPNKFRRLVGLTPAGLDFLWLLTGPAAFPSGPLAKKKWMIWTLFYLRKYPTDETCADSFVDVSQDAFLHHVHLILDHWGLHLQVVRVSDLFLCFKSI